VTMLHVLHFCNQQEGPAFICKCKKAIKVLYKADKLYGWQTSKRPNSNNDACDTSIIVWIRQL